MTHHNEDRPRLDLDHLRRQLTELLRHSRSFPPGRVSTYDAQGNETPLPKQL